MTHRNIMLPTTVLVLVLALALGLACPARGETFGDVVVSVEAPPAAQTIHGYAAYRVQVVNRSPDKPHTVTLTMPAESYSGGTRIRSLQRNIAVQAGGAATTILFQPAVEMAGSGLSVLVDGGAEKGVITLNLGYHKGLATFYGGRYFGTSGGGGESVEVLVSRGFGAQFGEIDARLTGAIPDSSATPGAGAGATPGTTGTTPTGTPPGLVLTVSGRPLTLKVIHAESDVGQWAGQWLAYSAYDMIVLSDGDMASMDAGVRTALWQYVQVGGVVTVVGHWQPPESWGAAAAPRATAGLTSYRVGFGCCLAIDSAPAKWSREDAQALAMAACVRQAPHLNMRTPIDANTVMPVVEKIAIPARGLLMIVILFALLIGPVNLVVLSRMKRKIHLLWTAPALSFLAAGTVVAYATFAEGFRGTGRTQGLTLLDERTGQAATVGWTAFYCPLTPGDGLHFGYDTELAPQIAQEGYPGYRGETTQSLTVDWTSDQHLTSGWVVSRMPLHLAVRKCEPRRERLLFQKAADGTARAVNGLGAPITHLQLRDGQGHLYEASNIGPGQDVALQSISPTSVAPPEEIVGGSESAFAGALQTFYTRGQWYDVNAAQGLPLKPGTYVAELDGTPFIEAGLANLKSQRAAQVVYGWLRDPSGAAAEAPARPEAAPQ